MISLSQIEFFLVVLVRVTGFFFTAPFFGLKNVPFRVKVGLSIALALVIMYSIPYQPLEYVGVIGYAVIVAGEVLAGVILGFLTNICYQILAMAGQLLDMEIGFSMVNEMDPVTSAQVTVSGNFYSYAVMLMLMVTYMHHYLLDAFIDTYTLIPVGTVSIDPGIYSVAVKFIADYFVIALRIVLPVFGAMLLVNSVLAILAKIAPQMSMFVIGIQLKVLVGLAVMLIVIELLPGISQMIFDEMMEVFNGAVIYL